MKIEIKIRHPVARRGVMPHRNKKGKGAYRRHHKHRSREQ